MSRPFPPPQETDPERFGELFLKDPSLFPARQAGEPWDRRTLIVDFAGGPYAFVGLGERQEADLRERFGDLVLAEGPGSETDPTPIRIFRASPDEMLDFDVRGWSYTFDRDYQPHAVRVAGLQFMARLDLEPRISAALWTPLDGGAVFLSQAENFFRLLVAYRLLALGGVLFHSAGVASGGRGFLFLGHSGAGKTTISRLSLQAGRTVLSDDMNALSPAQNGGPPTVEKLPFAGDLGRTPTPRARYPLAGWFRLRQGEPRLEAIRASRALAFLVGCAPFVNVDPHRADRLTDNLLALLDAFPLHELTFARDGDVWGFLETRQKTWSRSLDAP